MKVCPFCAEEIQDAAIVCKHCQRDLTTPAVRSRSATGWFFTVAKWGIGLLLAFIVIGALTSVSSKPPSTGRSLTSAQLETAIRGADERCPDVTRFMRMGARDGDEFWAATCSTGTSYSVMVRPNGSVRILDCAVMRAIAGVDCFTEFK